MSVLSSGGAASTAFSCTGSERARSREGSRRRIGERRDHVFESLRLAQESVGHPHREGALDPEQELRPREAVEAPVAFERAGQSAHSRAVRVDLARKLARDRDKREAYLFAGLVVGRLLHRPALGSSSPFIDPAVSPFEPREGTFREESKKNLNCRARPCRRGSRAKLLPCGNPVSGAAPSLSLPPSGS